MASASAAMAQVLRLRGGWDSSPSTPRSEAEWLPPPVPSPISVPDTAGVPEASAPGPAALLAGGPRASAPGLEALPAQPPALPTRVGSPRSRSRSRGSRPTVWSPVSDPSPTHDSPSPGAAWGALQALSHEQLDHVRAHGVSPQGAQSAGAGALSAGAQDARALVRTDM
eukprot:13335379-Alexandrium_andersonii.AAC.1